MKTMAEFNADCDKIAATIDIGNQALAEVRRLKAVIAALEAAAAQPVQPAPQQAEAVQPVQGLKADGIVGWRWVATCGSGSYQLRTDEPMRGYSYKAPVYEVPPTAGAQPAPQQAAVPLAVLEALDRMCTPLHESRLSGATAEADARSMKIIRDYIFAAPRAAAQVDHAQLIACLRGGRQCDETGEEIIMSRQACCEAADILSAAPRSTP